MLAHNIHQELRTQDIRISQDVTFDSMLLRTNTLGGLICSGFYKPSPIQLHGIPLGKCGFDLLLEAKSGTGKTAVFSVIALEKLDLSIGLQTLILAPTREIAAQICDVIRQIGSNFKGLEVEVVMGGLPLADDIEKFRKPVHIVVGSPGRIKHLIQDKYINTSAVRLLVLDEADKLIQKSFLKDIDFIFKSLPKQKQIILSSATYDEDSKNVINRYVQNAQHICPDSTSILLGLVQKFTVVKSNSNIVRQTQIRFAELVTILSRKSFKQCIIFCNYQARVSELHKLLARENWPAEQLYGQQEQTERLDSLKTLQEYKCRILISTDLAARGIDASNVDLVINFEPPYDWQTYLHRIGRAGRFGSYGIAISILVEGKEFAKFDSMVNSMKINVTKLWDHDTREELHVSENSQNSSASSLCQPLNVDINPKKSYEVLWHTLTKRNGNITTITESFEKLCESFQKADTNNALESFSDLMQSFSDSVNTPEQKTCYKHIKLDMIPQIKEYFIDIKDTKNDKTYFNSLVESNFEQSSYTCIEQNASNVNKISNISRGNKLENCSEYNKDCQEELKTGLSTNFSSQNQSVKSNKEQKISNNHKSNELEHGYYDYNIDCREELLKAGLPTEFSSHRQEEKSNTNDQKINNKHKSNTLTKNHLANHNLQGEIKVNCKSKNRNQSYETSSDSSLEESTRTEFSSTSSYKNNPRFNMQSRCHATHSRDQKFTSWYNQLKLRVKQIEMMVYMDEITKL